MEKYNELLKPKKREKKEEDKVPKDPFARFKSDSDPYRSYKDDVIEKLKTKLRRDVVAEDETE